MTFKHEIWAFTKNAAWLSDTFISKHGAFRPVAYRKFRKIAMELGATKFVRDTTVAGHHYSSTDGTLSVELH